MVNRGKGKNRKDDKNPLINKAKPRKRHQKDGEKTSKIGLNLERNLIFPCVTVSFTGGGRLTREGEDETIPSSQGIDEARKQEKTPGVVTVSCQIKRLWPGKTAREERSPGERGNGGGA